MITVEGSVGNKSTNNSTFHINYNLLNETAETTPQQVIKDFMRSLDESSETNPTAMLDEAIQSCSNFSGINDAINHFMNHLKVKGTTNFLTDCCGIILNNTDTGAISGSDAGSSTSAKTATSIVPEEGELNTSFNATSFTTNGLTLSLDSSYNGSEAQKTIWQALRTWWIDGALNLISESYGENFGFSSLTTGSTVKKITVKFYNKNDGTLASVSSAYNASTGDTTSLSLNINMHYYDSITYATVDKDGKSSKTSAYLDRVLAHELTHAVMAANISWFDKLPLFIVEGMAELTHGIDDLRKTSIINLLNNKTALKNALKLTTNYGKSDHQYSAGYVFLRYLAFQGAYGTADGTTGNDTLNNNKDDVSFDAFEGNDKISNNGSNVTIIGGKGNDNITLNGSDQIIQYGNGDGKDVIDGYDSDNGDVIYLNDSTLTNSSIKKNNVILKVGKGTITLKDTKGKLITIQDSSGTTTRMYGNGTVTVPGTFEDETLTAWTKADSINAYEGNDTLIGGKGADTLTGGDGHDVFYYSNGDGNDVITDYTSSDTIKIASGVISKVATVKNSSDISLKVGKGAIRIVNGVGKKIHINDENGNDSYQMFGSTSVNIANGDGSLMNYSIDSIVETLDASSQTTKLVLTANAKNNYIKLGSGNTTVTAGKGKDTVEYIAGNAWFTDYVTGQDVLKFNSDFTVKNVGNDFIFTTDEGKLTVSGAINKKGIAQKITTIDKNGVLSSQIYGTSTLTVANSDGDTINVENNSDVTLVNASKRSKAVYLIGNDFDNTIKGGTSNDTISALGGNDYITGGKGNDVFIYSEGDDTIADYSVAVNNSDVITLSGVTFDTYSINGKDAILSFSDTTKTLTLLNAKDKTITLNGSAKTLNDINEKIFTNKISASTYVADGDVVSINAVSNSLPINIIGNFKDNIIKGSKKADTIDGSGGDDSLIGGKGNDLFIYSSGNDTISDYVAGQDQVSIGATDIVSANYKGKDLILKVDEYHSLTILNAKNKKNIAQKITFNEQGNITSQVYGDNAVTITGTTGNDVINLSNMRATKSTTINYTAGNDIINNFAKEDLITLSKGQSFASATKVSDTNYKVTINKGKKEIGTLNINGEFTTGEEKTSSTVTSYIKIGSNKITYAVKPVETVSAAYEERWFIEDNFINSNLNSIVNDNSYEISLDEFEVSDELNKQSKTSTFEHLSKVVSSKL